MQKTTAELKRTFENGRPSERAAATWEIIANLDELLPWLEARQLASISIRNKGDEWLLIVRAWYGRKPQVAFVGADNPEECLVTLAHMVLFGLLTWKPDKYTTMRSDNN